MNLGWRDCWVCGLPHVLFALVAWSFTSAPAHAFTARWNEFARASALVQAGMYPACAVDTRRGELIMFGMYTPSFCANTSCFPASDAAYTTIARVASGPVVDPPVVLMGSPGPRSNACAAYDSLTDRVWVFGGRHIEPGSCGLPACFDAPRPSLNDLWWLDRSVDPPQWHEALVGGARPLPRFDATLMVDPIAHRLLLFGGRDSSGTFFQDLWSLSLEGPPGWSLVIPAGSLPSARSSATALFDGTHARLLLVGGVNAAGTTTDVWALSLGSTLRWSALAVAGTPPAVMERAALDRRRDRVVTYSDPSNIATFALGGTPTWESVPSVDPPANATPGGFGYDPVHDYYWVPYVSAVSLGRGTFINTQALFTLEEPAPPPALKLQLGRPGPNPAGASVAFDFGSGRGGTAIVRLLDLRGREVMRRSYTAPFLFRETLDLAGLGPGLYVISLEQGSERVTRRLIVFR